MRGVSVGMSTGISVGISVGNSGVGVGVETTSGLGWRIWKKRKMPARERTIKVMERMR